MFDNITFDDEGRFMSWFSRPEIGPLRPSNLSLAEREALPPPWAFLDHDALPYVTTADHRSVEGRIVPQGTEMKATRSGGVVELRTLSVPAQIVVLDGRRWCVPAVGAPRLSPEDCPELFLPA